MIDVKRDWLRAYLKYTSKQESPAIFHLWCGASVLAGALGRNVWIDRGYYKTYPNMYVVLVAPTGRCRKSTAVNIASDLLRMSGLDIFKEKITAASVISRLYAKIVIKDGEPRGESKAFIQAPEFSVFLGTDSITQGLLPLLTTLYDSPDVWEYSTRSYGIERLYRVCVNILGSSTPDWLANSIPTDAIGGGFMGRVLFVAQLETPRKFPRMSVNQNMLDLRDALVRRLIEIREKFKGSVVLSKDAEDLFDEWYAARELPDDERFLGFSEREHDHVLKTAIVLATSDGNLDHSDVIGTECLEQAIKHIETVKKYMHLAFWGIGDHIAARGYEKVLGQIKQLGGKATFRTLLAKNYHHYDVEAFRKVMELLEETGRVKCEISGRSRWYTITKKGGD